MTIDENKPNYYKKSTELTPSARHTGRVWRHQRAQDWGNLFHNQEED
jgi:hypothetical protein